MFTLAVTGCVISHGTRVPGTNYARTDPQNVELLYQEPPKAYQVVGFVAIDRGGGVTDAGIEKEFRVEGSKLGADAVIIDALPVHGLFTTVQGKGKAIRWKP